MAGFDDPHDVAQLALLVFVMGQELLSAFDIFL